MQRCGRVATHLLQAKPSSSGSAAPADEVAAAIVALPELCRTRLEAAAHLTVK
jgi:hypothetical protein